MIKDNPTEESKEKLRTQLIDSMLFVSRSMATNDEGYVVGAKVFEISISSLPIEIFWKVY